MIVVVDSDGLIGSLNPDDSHFEVSQKLLSTFINKKAKLIYPATVIAESVTFLQGRLNKPELAKRVIQLVHEDKLNVELVDNIILKQASVFMDFKRSKRHTLFDAIVAAVAQKHHADAIFSFDTFYKKHGFNLASEI